MRGKDVRSFMRVARHYCVIILIRHTNDDSLRYVGKEGFYPKPAVVKAKTADVNPPSRREFVEGQLQTVAYEVAGLVVHPGFQPDSYHPAKRQKAQGCWDDTMKTLLPEFVGRRVDLRRPETWAEWSVERTGKKAPAWKWRVEVDQHSPRFGCLQLQRDGGGWCYVHGDYDLKDVIVVGAESVNERREGTRDGVKNYTPKLPKGMEWTAIRDALNTEVGVEMVQHGAEAQFAWHGDEPITVVYPDWRFEILADPLSVQSWYEKLQRQVLGTGRDYRRDPARMFFASPEGLLRVDALPEGFNLAGA